MSREVFAAVVEQLRPHVPPVRVAVLYHIIVQPLIQKSCLALVGHFQVLTP